MTILDYLEQEYQPKTARSYYKEWLLFLDYLRQQVLDYLGIKYPHILNYVQYLQGQNIKASSINRKLQVIEKVYTFVLEKQPNPVQGLRVKTGTRNSLQSPIDMDTLTEIVENLAQESAYQKRNYLMLSLIHYQALRAAELSYLTTSHINLKKATIFVPKVQRSNSRTLGLNALQIIALQSYLSNERKALLTYPTNQLFITGGSSKSLSNSLDKLKKKLQKQLPQLQNLAHWRSSVIIHWLEEQPLLQVQQRLGHRFASSTEKYQIHAIKNLQNALLIHHPLMKKEG